MAEIDRFHTFISREGDAGAVRGKIPVAMARQLGADEGSVIEWHVSKKTVVGAKVLHGRDADRVRTARGAGVSTPKSTSKKAKLSGKSGKSQKVDKPVVKGKSGKIVAPIVKGGKVKGQKIAAPTVKGNKRRTQVEYDDPKPKKGGKGTLPKLKLGKKR